MSSEEVVREFLEYRKKSKLTDLFESWLPYLTVNEEAVIILYYFKDKKIYQIAMEINYSETQVKRILKSAKKKIKKLLP